jgi:hypothetical protein
MCMESKVCIEPEKTCDDDVVVVVMGTSSAGNREGIICIGLCVCSPARRSRGGSGVSDFLSLSRPASFSYIKAPRVLFLPFPLPPPNPILSPVPESMLAAPSPSAPSSEMPPGLHSMTTISSPSPLEVPVFKHDSVLVMAILMLVLSPVIPGMNKKVGMIEGLFST